MTEKIVTTTELRREVAVIKTPSGLLEVGTQLVYLTDEATDRLNFALIEANEILFSIRALKHRSIIENSTDR
ncbi:MAG TPA: hypothetical protein VIM31_04020 [Candidatus Microsaccharimonas sp.]|jgi:hypothetical protein